jgi:hypothetical protein
MRGAPVFTLRPVVPAPAAADAGGQGRPEPPVGCDAVLFCGVCDALSERPGTAGVPLLLPAVPLSVVLPAIPLLLVLPAIPGGCAALGLLWGVTVVVGGATALGLLAGPRTVGPIVPPDGGAVVAVPGDDVPGDAGEVVAPEEVPPVLPELDPPVLPPDEPVWADTKPAPASSRAADNKAI